MATAEAEAIARELHAAIQRAVTDLSATDQEIWRRLEVSQSYGGIRKPFANLPRPSSRRRTASGLTCQPSANRLPQGCEE